MTTFNSLILLLCLFFLSSVEAYLNFGEGKRWADGDNIPVQTVKLTSVELAFPYKYYVYHGKDLPFVRPAEHIGEGTCRLGECLSGDRKQDSTYKITAKEDIKCAFLSDDKANFRPVVGDGYELLNELIKYDYRAQLVMDGLPIAEPKSSRYEIGYRIGYHPKNDSSVHNLNNHLIITVGYTNSTSAEGIQIVRFTVEPKSVTHTDKSKEECRKGTFVYSTTRPYTITDMTGKVDSDIWSYNVTWVWENANISYATRWDPYFTVNTELHTVSLVYGIVVTLALSIFLAVVLVKIVHSSPISKFNLDDVEESGWKTLHGDVFRPPHHFMILSVLIGGGAQILATALFVLLLGTIGALTPVQSGSLNTGIVVIYPMLGFVGGYTSARVYARLGGGRKRRNAVFTAIGFNGILFLVWFIAEIILWSRHSTAGDVGSFFAVFALWLFVHTPLVFLGSFFAYKRPVGTNPTGTNTIPRMIPPAPWYSHTYLLTPLLAILPYGVSFNELYDVMDAMWSHHVYYYFGMVFVVFLLLTIIIAEVSVILCYFQLANENYHWWWRAFYIPGAICGYIFLTAVFYVAVDLDLESAASVFLYLSYTTILLLVFFVFMSSIAFYACWTFVHKIYSTLHVD